MQWEGLSGWNGLLGLSGWNVLLGIWGLESEWTVRDREEAAWGRQQERALGMGTGHSGWGRCSEQEEDAWNRERALGIETGLLRTDAGKAVRGAVSEKCEAFGASRAS